MTAPPALVPSPLPTRGVGGRGVGALVLRRVLFGVPLLLGVTLVMFLLASWAPVDPVLQRLGSRAFSMDAATLEAMRAAQGEQSVWQQWATWWGRALQGDLGVSLGLRQDVSTVIAERLPWTVLLVGVSLAPTVLVGLGLGAWAAYRVGGWTDRVVTATSYGLQASPVFWVALLMMWLFAVWLGWFPAGGLTEPGSDTVSIGGLARHLVLPATVLTLTQLPWFVLVVRDSVRDELTTPHVLGAQSRGLSEPRVLVAHALRSALLPVCTVLGVRLPELVTGAVLVETVFAWPGVAAALVEAALAVDFALLAGLTVLTTVVVVLGNLLADVSYRLLDPRVIVRHG